MFSSYVYEMMLEEFEMWFVYGNGSAMQISDCSLMDN